MKKIIILILTVIVMTGCFRPENPRKYRGCVVIRITNEHYANGNVYLKATPELAKQRGDYFWIGVPDWEKNQLHVGDTIK